MPEKEKVKDVQSLANTLDSLPETVKQRILGVAEGYQLAIDASKEKKENPACLCVNCTCTGCHEECYGHCHGCGHLVDHCNSYQDEGEKWRLT